jgi:Arc/MetJ family transcription regulator
VKTLIDIDPELLDHARRILGTTTKKATVNAALGEVVRLDAAEAFVRLAQSDVFHRPADNAGSRP